MSETKTLHKWFWVWEFEKEERWLNLLCATLLAYGLGRIRGKQDTLEEERALHE